MSESLLAAVAALGLPSIVGRSTLGLPIAAGAVGAGPGGPLLIIGGVHGDEPSSVAAVVALAQALAAAPPRERAVWLLPVMNPDGLRAGTKNSAADVDLNRNFPAQNFSPVHKPGYFPGPSPASEPETRAVVALIDRLSPVAVVAVHAPLECVNYDGPAAKWAAEVARSCGWPAREDIGYPTPGSLGSWLGRERGRPVLTLELPPGPYGQFHDQAQAALQTAINRVEIG